MTKTGIRPTDEKFTAEPRRAIILYLPLRGRQIKRLKPFGQNTNLIFDFKALYSGELYFCLKFLILTIYFLIVFHLPSSQRQMKRKVFSAIPAALR
jgi:hypothetical protein